MPRGRERMHMKVSPIHPTCIAPLVSRVPSISQIAELMLTEGLTVLDAVRRGKEARGVILTNHSFQQQLVRLARGKGLLGPQPSGLPAMRARKPRRPAAHALRGL